MDFDLVKIPQDVEEKKALFGLCGSDGVIESYVSPKLVVKQRITYEELDVIKMIHREKIDLFKAIEEEDDPVKLKELAKQITDIEYCLQDAWKFERDIKNHTLWFNAPKCTCPKIDNMDDLGSGFAHMASDCPLHGD